MCIRDRFAIDTETTGLDYFKDIIVGISVSLPSIDKHYYIPVNHTEGRQLPADYVFNALKPILENPMYRKILFNAKYDAHMFIRHGIYMTNIYFDGFVAMKLLNENEESYALKNLATKYGKHFGFEDKSATYEELFGKGGFQDAQFETADGKRGIAVYYACKDTHLTYRFYKDFVMKHFERLPKLKSLYFDIERPITDICIDMEQNGFLIDMSFAEKYGRKLSHQITRLEKVLTGVFGDININSPAQLSVVLYDTLGLQDVSKKRSTDAKTLKKLAKHHKGVKLLLKYRDLMKLFGTYIHPMPNMIEKDGRLHGQFKQVSTATGRFASSNPNLQNLPALARKMIVSPNGYVIIGSDFSQIEPRILAHFTGDESMIDAYVTGRDLYVEMAMKVFGFEMKYCLDKAKSPDGTFEPRRAVKSVLLGIMYGMGSKTLAGNLGMTEAQAKQIIDDFYAAFPKVKTWMDEKIRFAEENEYIETMFGRKRRFVGFKVIAKRWHKISKQVHDMLGYEPDFIWAEELPYDVKREYWDLSRAYGDTVRKVVNTVIQGSAADVMKLAMIAVNKILKLKGWKMLATIHDEILMEVPETITLEEVQEIENAMLNVVQLKTPMKVDTEFMTRWSEGVGKDKWFKKAS